jgi:hypothetical protein
MVKAAVAHDVRACALACAAGNAINFNGCVRAPIGGRVGS